MQKHDNSGSIKPKITSRFQLDKGFTLPVDRTHLNTLRKRIKALQKQREVVERGSSNRIWNYGKEQIKL